MVKTGVTVTSTIWLISPNADRMRGMRQTGLVAVTRVLSTAIESDNTVTKFIKTEYMKNAKFHKQFYVNTVLKPRKP